MPILRAHLGGPLRLPDLRNWIDGAPPRTLRGQIDTLRGIGALERRVVGGMPYTVENELTEAGRGILAVAELVEGWLARAPQGPIALGSEQAKDAIRALIGGWSSTMLGELAVRPLSLTELDSAIGELSYPALERRLSAMRAVHQVEAKPGGGPRGKFYAVTEWTRQAAGPLVAAGRCEYELRGGTPPLTRVDMETAFLLAVPLVNLEGIRDDSDFRLAEGQGSWAVGGVGQWADAILEGRLDGLRLGGEKPDLAKAVIEALHAAL